MGKHEKLVLSILKGGSDANIAFKDLCELLKRFGFVERTKSQVISGAASTSYADKIQTFWRRLMFKYETIIYWSEEDKVYVAEVPELLGCIAHGDSDESALKNAKEAVQLWLDTAREYGDPIPEPKGHRLMYA